MSSSGRITAPPIAPTPAGNVSISSGNVANAQAQAILPGAAGKLTWLTGFVITAAGATAALDVTVTVGGASGLPLSFTFTFPAGATVAAQPLIVCLPTPLPSVAVNTPISVTLPAGGAGNTNAAVTAFGFQA